MSSDQNLAADREADHILSDDYRATIENIFPGKGERIAGLMYDALVLAFLRGVDWQRDQSGEGFGYRRSDHPSLTDRERNPTLR